MAWRVFGWLMLLAMCPQFLPGQGFTPEESVRRMQVPPEFQVQLVASEPQIQQPICVKFDERGRLWTIQYLQYPNPAGLKRVKVDRWSRTVYDRIPEPPPKGPRGADKISVLIDSNQDGTADQIKDVITGLNLCTGLEFGHGGLYVLQVPYLLYYPDKDHDDVPDTDPEVLLEGFGMEDAQSFANHLTWGPDGWLYGVNGSTTTCRIRGIEFQQGVWRYHPLSREFELFCEGGGNTFGLTFDARGNLIYTNNGGYLAFHALQGAYYQKTFSKHGPLHNPYAYGYFPEMKKVGSVPGAPSTGGTIYLGSQFPERFSGSLISGNFLGHSISWWKMSPLAATLLAEHAGILLNAQDTWSCPTDLCQGPDGAIYWSDFYDQRTAHPDPDANWDRSNGRIYRISAKGQPEIAPVKLRDLPLAELVQHLNQPGWHADRARRILAERRDQSVIPLLQQRLVEAKDPLIVLQHLWALSVSEGLDDATATKLLDHPDASVRWWAVRLLGDRKQVSPIMQRRLQQLAGNERDVMVRCQLAATARRLRKTGLALLLALLESGAGEVETYSSMMLWWGLESFALSDRETLIQTVVRPGACDKPLIQFLIEKLMRRYAAEGTRVGYLACATLWQAKLPSIDSDKFQTRLETALSLGLSERSSGLPPIGNGDLLSNFGETGANAATAGEADQPPAPKKFEPLSDPLSKLILDRYQAKNDSVLIPKLAFLTGDKSARKQFYQELATGDPAARKTRLSILEELGEPDCIAIVLPLLQSESRLQALRVLARFDQPAIVVQALSLYTVMNDEEKRAVRDLCLRRAGSTRVLLDLVEKKQIKAEEVPLDQVRLIALHQDDVLNGIVRKLWGNIQPGTPEEKLATVRRFKNDLRAAGGNAANGKLLFTKHCAVCHKLFNEGGTVGPDLTAANRSDQEFLLVSLVDPNSVVKSQFLNFSLSTKNGGVLQGLIAEQSDASLTLLDAKAQRHVIARNEIDELKESAVSLMPERLLEQLTPQELRDLFAYLQRK